MNRNYLLLIFSLFIFNHIGHKVLRKGRYVLFIVIFNYFFTSITRVRGCNGILFIFSFKKEKDIVENPLERPKYFPPKTTLSLTLLIYYLLLVILFLHHYESQFLLLLDSTMYCFYSQTNEWQSPNSPNHLNQ